MRATLASFCASAGVGYSSLLATSSEAGRWSQCAEPRTRPSWWRTAAHRRREVGKKIYKKRERLLIGNQALLFFFFPPPFRLGNRACDARAANRQLCQAIHRSSAQVAARVWWRTGGRERRGSGGGGGGGGGGGEGGRHGCQPTPIRQQEDALLRHVRSLTSIGLDWILWEKIAIVAFLLSGLAQLSVRRTRPVGSQRGVQLQMAASARAAAAPKVCATGRGAGAAHD